MLALRDRLARLDLRGAAGGSSSNGALQHLWSCPKGQHITALIAAAPSAPGAAASASGGGAGEEHLIAAACSSGAPGGNAATLLLFDLRRPQRPLATWHQAPMGGAGGDPVTLLRWLPGATASSAAAAAEEEEEADEEPGSPGGDPLAAGDENGAEELEQRQQQQGSGGGSSLLVAGLGGSGRAVGCQFGLAATAPALLAREGRHIGERPAGSGAAALRRLQVALRRQELQEEQERPQAAAASVNEEEEEEDNEGEDEEGADPAAAAMEGVEEEEDAAAARGESSAAAPAAAAAGRGHAGAAPAQPSLAPPALLRRPQPMPGRLALLWQPASSVTVRPLPGPPLQLLAPAEEAAPLSQALTAGRLQLQARSAAAGGGVRVSRVPLPAHQQLQQQQLLGLAATTADWRSGRQLPVPLLSSLTPHGDVALSLLQPTQPPLEGAAAAAAGAADAAVTPLPLLLPAAPAADSSDSSDGGGNDDAEGRQRRRRTSADGLVAAAGAGAKGASTSSRSQLLPYVRGVPRAVVALVARGELK